MFSAWHQVGGGVDSTCILGMKGLILSVGLLAMTIGPRTQGYLLMQDWDATLLIIVLFLSIMHILLPHFHSRSLDSGCLAAKLLIHSLLTGVEDIEMLTKSLGAYTNYIYRTAVNQMRALPIRLYF